LTLAAVSSGGFSPHQARRLYSLLGKPPTVKGLRTGVGLAT